MTTAATQPRRTDGRWRDVDVEELGQLAFPIVPLVDVDNAKHLTIQARFEEFHRLNPWVFEALEQLTRDWLARGRKRLSTKMLFEVIRWHYGRATKSSDFRLNNNMTSRYARLLVATYPEFADAFELRELRAD